MESLAAEKAHSRYTWIDEFSSLSNFAAFTMPRLPVLSIAVVLCATTSLCVAGGQEVDPSPARLAASGIHHAPHSDEGFQNADGPLPRASLWKWRWNRLIHGLPPPPANHYAFPVDQPDVEWIKANRSETTPTWIGHASALLQIDGNILTDPEFPNVHRPSRSSGRSGACRPA